jgi:hypothetical protein
MDGMFAPGSRTRLIKNVLRDILQKVQVFHNSWRAGHHVDPHFVITPFCKSGFHRSVLVSWLGHAVVQWFFGTRVQVTLDHLSHGRLEPNWTAKCFGDAHQYGLVACVKCEGATLARHRDIWGDRQQMFNEKFQWAFEQLGRPWWDKAHQLQ